jgi:nicotinamide riboside transporter PnuC
MLELIGTAATILAIAGVVLNNHRLRFCFILLLISNSLSAAVHLDCQVWSLLCRDLIFIVLGVDGWFRWGRCAPAESPQSPTSR